MGKSNYIKVICAHCKKEFEKQVNHFNYNEKLNRQHFCDTTCRDEFMKIINLVKCDQCGKVFKRLPSRNKGDHHFCSYSCSAT